MRSSRCATRNEISKAGKTACSPRLLWKTQSRWPPWPRTRAGYGKILAGRQLPAPNKTRDMRNGRLRTASMKNTLKSSVPGRFLLPRCAGGATERRSKNALYKRQPAPLLQGKLVHSTAGCAISPEAIWPLRIQGEKKVMPGSIAAQVFTGFPRIREQTLRFPAAPRKPIAARRRLHLPSHPGAFTAAALLVF